MKLELVRTSAEGPIPPCTRPMPENYDSGEMLRAQAFRDAHCHLHPLAVAATLGIGIVALYRLDDGWLWFATPDMHAEALRRIEALWRKQ